MPERRSVLAVAALGLLLAVAGDAQEAEETRIGSIDVEGENVFGPDDTSRGFLYRGANALHVVTRESTVRRWLLFSEGDVYDPALVAESERLLRAVGLFRSVSITATPPGPDGSTRSRAIGAPWSTWSSGSSPGGSSSD